MSERIIPDGNPDAHPISGLEEFQAHLAELENDPSVPFNLKLLDDIELQLTESNIPPLLPTVLPPLTQILKSTTQDPSPLLSLTIKLLSPLTFTRTLTIADPPSILTALNSPLSGANLLALAIIHKAAKAPTEAALLSTLPDVVEALIRRWLESPDVGVGERAAKVLGDLLESDCETIRPAEGVNGASSYDFNGLSTTRRRIPGHGRLWRVIFTQRPFLELIKTLCSPETAHPPTRPRHQTSLSQGRLLRLLTRLATLDIRAISTAHHQALFPLSTTAIAPSDQGILQWAALEMLSGSDDILMHLNLIDFFETFVSVMRVSRLTPEENAIVKKLVKVATEGDGQLKEALRGLPNRTVEEEAEPLRAYISDLLD
ncbi:hypothetical protein M441DRAFT_25493 [Trichoderma asperellum CBS 433.97]|uniref:DNA mismatch repair protein HSM3 N-terminal domain-containing protein n=1 Tax=Trichoderma asperellum (strain ATCC 204424 / CBS 433.97 / NBRC 101777) TaxID=1042311 RepID=A0A2T3ZF91_TRIA4|nr:hypothetical protein M441DRAFT_25493 [Trichoderma asperellum CBS 433.97]PTB43466.1 hypothetical protein M441DRAFT_25493 [Trichoderma asperellum CBS 433.97]